MSYMERIAMEKLTLVFPIHSQIFYYLSRIWTFRTDCL